MNIVIYLLILFLSACSTVEKKKIEILAVDHNLAGVGAALPIDWNNYEENKSIFFDRELDFIDDKNRLLLSAHVSFLRRNSNLKIRLLSIADDSSNLLENENLAKLRADKVRKELINSGIENSRILSAYIKANVNKNGKSLNGSRRVDLLYFFNK